MGAFWRTLKYGKGRCLVLCFFWGLFKLCKLVNDCILRPMTRAVTQQFEIVSQINDNSHLIEIDVILGRWKMDIMQPNSCDDFITTYKHQAHIDLLLDPRWSLYCLSRTKATFVRLPLSIDHYQAISSSMHYLTQHCEATHVTQIPLRVMIQFAAQIERERAPNTHLVQFSATGGTAEDGLHVLRLCQRSRKVQCYNDVDYFTSIAALYDQRLWNDEFTCEILSASLSIFCKNTPVNTTCIVKNRWFSNQLLPLCRRATPHVQHVLLYTRHIGAATNTLARQLASRRIIRTVYEWKRNGGIYLDNLFISLSGLEATLMQRVRPETLWEYAAIVLGVSYERYFTCLQGDERILAISVEQLAMYRRDELIRLYEWLQLPLEDIPIALENLADDALNNRPDFSEGVDQMRSSADRCLHLARIMSLPDNFYAPNYLCDHRHLIE